MIPCSSMCIYQRDGFCSLDYAAAVRSEERTSGCIHYVPYKEVKHRKNDKKESGKNSNAEEIKKAKP